MNTELRKKNEVKKDLFKLMNNSVFVKTIINITKYKDNKFFTENFVGNRNEKNSISFRIQFNNCIKLY